MPTQTLGRAAATERRPVQEQYTIRYCARCVMPETKPDLHIDENGVCSACRHYENRPEVDWAARKTELLAILDRHRSRDATRYDCIIPVSGGPAGAARNNVLTRGWLEEYGGLLGLRVSDLVGLHIRRGRLSRSDALELVIGHDGKFPWSYLGCTLEEILDDIGMRVDEFIKVCDRFTNKKLFLTNTGGNLVKDKDGSLTKVNYDNP